LRLSNPLTMTDIPMPQDLAEKMLKIINARKSDLAKRSVFTVLRVHLVGSDPLSGATETSSMTVTANLDEILIYDSPDRGLLLYSKKFKDPVVEKTLSR